MMTRSDEATERRSDEGGRWLAWLAVVAVVAAALAVVITRTAGVRRRAAPGEGTSAIGAEDVRRQIGPQQIDRHLAPLARFPTRIAGTEGHDAAVAHVRRTFERLRLAVLEQTVEVTVPVTRYCEVRDAGGAPIPDVALHPFWPNYVRTCTIAEPGVSATAVRADDGGAYLHGFAGHDPQVTIPLVRLTSSEAWIGLADAGFPAVIFYRDEHVRPGDFRTKELDFPAGFPRFLLDGDPQALHGRAIRVRCRVDWQAIRVPQIVGVLDPPSGPADEAVVLTAHYDSISSVPDRAPGAEEACSLAALLAAAEFAAANRDQLTRTMLFIALAGRGQACRGVRELADIWGQPGEEQAARDATAARISGLDRAQGVLDAARHVLADADYWAITADDLAESRYWQVHGQPARAALVDAMRRVIEGEIEQAQEQLIRRDLARQRSGDLSASPEAASYQQARREVERRRVAATATLLDLKRHHGLGGDHARRSALGARIEAKAAGQARALDDLRRVQALQRRLHGFRRHIVFCLAVTTAAPSSAVLANYPNSRQSADSAAGWLGPLAGQLLHDMGPLLPALAEADPTDAAAVAESRKLLLDGVAGGRDLSPQGELIGGSMYYPFLYYYEYLPLLGAGRHAMAWANPADPARHTGTPDDTFDRLDAGNLLLITRVIALSTARMGAGNVSLNATPHLPRTKSARGQVLQAADPNSVIPTRGVERALVVARHAQPMYLGSVRQEDVTFTDGEGAFRFPPCDSIKPPSDFQAFRLDAETGALIAVKDQGEKGEGSFPSARTWNNFDNPLRLVLFRCAQTDLFYPRHPSTGLGLGSAFCIDRRTLAPLPSFAVLSGNPFRASGVAAWNYDLPGQGFSLFNPPASRVYIGLRSASPLDATMEAVVAYLLGSPPLPPLPPPGREIWGPGYLAQDVPAVRLWMRDAAASMVAVNGFRLQRHQRHRLADPVLLQQQDRARQSVDAGERALADGDVPAALHQGQDALAIAMEVYPRIGRTERDAVIGVLFYLFLVIPFAIFVERLLFGFADIRAQIGGVVGVFALVFAALRQLHPAFELVSSALIVLVGFLTLALSLFVTIFLFGKFQQNIRDLRLKLQRTAEAADVSRIAAAGTAFLLGINNMRKRRVRTAFTCVTLVLVTFALLSLTAVRRESRFQRIAVGSAPYTGLLITGPNQEPLPGTTSLIERFGRDFVVSRLYWRSNTRHVRSRGGTGASLGRPGESGSDRYPVSTYTNVVGFDPQEARVTHMDSIVVAGRWFRSDSEAAVLLPASRARELGVTHAMAAAGETTVYVDGQGLRLIGLFDPARLEQARDLNGDGLLPFDGASLDTDSDAAAAGAPTARITPPTRLPRLPGDEVVLMPALECGGVVSRLAVHMGAMTPRQAMAHITDFLQRWEGYVHYGVGGVAYYGRIYRGTHVEGLAEILVPLLIAAAIVLNTMLGSVYERTAEIGVYSAVGLSPSHVHYLFLAEACVYATIGSVAGYLLAHGTGALLAALGLTRGLAFNYSTMSTVYATVALIVAVLLSTWYPARKAARLASPAGRAAIDVPSADGHVMNLDLPFTYVELDAISVIPYLHDVLEDHGEGSSAEFHCDSPQLAGEGGAAVPADERQFGLQTRCWLRPYDLGVSQMMTLSIRPTAFEGVWHAQLRLERLTGDIDSWRRANHLFLRVLRKHFLAWRGLRDEQKDEYLVRGLAVLDVPIERFLATDAAPAAGPEHG